MYGSTLFLFSSWGDPVWLTECPKPVTDRLSCFRLANVRPYQMRIVPMGPPITSASEHLRLVENNARRLEVLRNCVSFIFDNRISDARIVSGVQFPHERLNLYRCTESGTLNENEKTALKRKCHCSRNVFLCTFVCLVLYKWTPFQRPFLYS